MAGALAALVAEEEVVLIVTTPKNYVLNQTFVIVKATPSHCDLTC